MKKLVIAKINSNIMCNIKGGDCLPTEPGWYEHLESDAHCDGRETP
ncbi:hypothetical protein [uncultured Lacinutrix sp.]|nr:hypothetical protein [uncultured Lacinutrix sp.]